MTKKKKPTSKKSTKPTPKKSTSGVMRIAPAIDLGKLKISNRGNGEGSRYKSTFDDAADLEIGKALPVTIDGVEPQKVRQRLQIALLRYARRKGKGWRLRVVQDVDTGVVAVAKVAAKGAL